MIGGGIGGMASAIALRRAGIQTTAYESSERPAASGAGIVLAANSMKALAMLGLADTVTEAGAVVTRLQFRRQDGGVLKDLSPADFSPDPSARMIAIHRTDLHNVLSASPDAPPIRFNSECTGFEQDDDGVTATFSDGSHERADLLVGADGLWSEVRSRLHGDAAPRFAGYSAWRGIAIPGAPPLPEGVAFEATGRGTRFGCAPLGSGRFYWWGAFNASSPQAGGEANGRRTAALAEFEGWHGLVRSLIDATPEDEMLLHAIYDRDPLKERWGEGRVTLLGDAAHPMTPDLGQGASQALEDAVVLAKAMGGADGIEDGLRRYEKERSARTSPLVRRSRLMGRIGQAESLPLRWLRDAALRVAPNRLVASQLRSVTRFPG
ncbi:MAG: FAD-dependent monooxygenase [Dehalococcoidia bacterium]